MVGGGGGAVLRYKSNRDVFILVLSYETLIIGA